MGGWNQVLAKANYSRSSSGCWCFWLNWICVNVMLYFSLVLPIFLIGVTLHWEVEIELLQRQTVQDHHQDDDIFDWIGFVWIWCCTSHCTAYCTAHCTAHGYIIFLCTRLQYILLQCVMMILMMIRIMVPSKKKLNKLHNYRYKYKHALSLYFKCIFIFYVHIKAGDISVWIAN